MKKLVLISIIILLGLEYLRAQGIVRGKITDEKGEAVIGATIVLKSNKSVGVVADLDGNYSLNISENTPQTLIISFISYKAIEEEIHPKNSEVIIRNFVMKPSAHEVKEVQVTAKAVRSKEYYTEMVKKNSAISIDYISSETMKKTGDASVVAAVARVTGVSTNGNFITVRGIGDRYIKTAVNGSRIPTLDPFTNNIKLDLFPSSLVDNIIISKTASPDNPGDWAGAYISVETKDYPEELAVNLETSVGYNNHSSYQDVITSQRSSTDWLGYDDGFRDHDHESFIQANPDPTLFQEMSALGLDSYFASLGVNNGNWYQDNSNGDTYFKLGLIQLGLLEPALINNEAAFTQAKLEYYSGSYQSSAFQVINAGVPASAKTFPNNWSTSEKQGPLNFSQSISVGNQIKFFGRPLGFIAGYRYGSSMQYDRAALSNRTRFDGSLESSTTQQLSSESNGWSALLNIAYKLNPNHNLSFLFMPNILGVNKVRSAVDSRDSTRFVITKNHYYEERRQVVYQFKSEHYLPQSGIRMEINASYTEGKSGIPDFKNLQYWRDARSNVYSIGGDIGDGIHRYYRYLQDDLFDSRLSAEVPIVKKTGLKRKLKFGGAYLKNDRKSDQYDYGILLGKHSNVTLVNDDLTSFFDYSNFEITSGMIDGIPYSTMNEYYTEDGTASNHTFGNSEIMAGYVMADYDIFPKVRLAGGLRVEKARIYTDVSRFDSLGYAIDDPRRAYSPSSPIANPGRLNEISFLPSLNLVLKLKDDEQAPMYLRMNYSRTVARPSIRELSDIALYDYELKGAVFGNSELKMVHIDNYDIRLESYFKSGDNLSLSLFHKDFRDHIELVNTAGYTWQNVSKSTVSGIELEGRKKITRHFETGANVTIIYSNTEVARTRLEYAGGGVKEYIPVDTVSHSMFGQAPYVVNALLTYTADSAGLTATISYNLQGPRLVITSFTSEIPDIYEIERHLLDFKLMKKIGKHFNAGVTIKDILGSSMIWQYKGANDYEKYTYGTSYILSLAYKL